MSKNSEVNQELSELLKNLGGANKSFSSLIGGLGGLDEVIKQINNDGKSDGGTKKESLNKAQQGLNNFINVIRETVSAVDQFKEVLWQINKTGLNSGLNAANLKNQLMKLDFDKQTFEQKWKNTFKSLDFQKQGMEVNLRQSNLDYQKFLATGLDQARLTMDQANFAVEQAALGIKRAILGVTQAQQAYINALFAYRAASIAAARADLDYQNKLMQIEGNLINARKTAAESTKAYMKGLESLYEPWFKLDDAAATYTKTIGGSKESMALLKKETFEFANKANLQGKYNTSATELIELQTKYNQELGRSVKLTDSQKESLAAMKQVYGKDKSMEMLTKFTTFGYDFNRAAGLAGKMFSEASKKGIAVEKYTKNMLSNLKMAQTLTFSEGLKGLQKMAERATELNMNMQETAKAADKLSTVEGAMQASSQLSVLGGNFAAFSNPLAMMNEAINDVGSLQERIIEQFSDLASWDSEKGEISMSGVDRMRMKAASQALGMDAGEMSNMVFEKARRDKLAPEIDNLNLSDDLKHLLTNVAQLNEKGEGYVNIKGKEVSLQEAQGMDPEELAEALRVANSSDSDNIKEIAQSVFSIKDAVEGWNKSWDDSLNNVVEKSGLGEQFHTMVQQGASRKEELEAQTSAYVNASKEQLDFQKKNAEWQASYLGQTAKYERMSAELQREQAHFGKQTAATAVKSAALAKISAVQGVKSAQLAYRSAVIQQKNASFAEAEYYIQKDQKALNIARQKFELEDEFPLRQKQTVFDYLTAKNTMDLYEVQRLMLQLDYAEKAAQYEESSGKRTGMIIGGVVMGVASILGAVFTGGVSLAGLAAAGALITGGMAAGSQIGGTVGKWRGRERALDNLGITDEEISRGIENSLGSRNESESYIAGNGGNWGFDSVPTWSNGGYVDMPKFDVGGNTTSRIRNSRRKASGYMSRGYDDNNGGAGIVGVKEFVINRYSVPGSIKTLTALNDSRGSIHLDDYFFSGQNPGFNQVNENYTPSTDGNNYNPMTVANTVRDSYNGASSSENTTNNGEPIKIELSGRIELSLNGASANIDASELLQNPNFIEGLTAQISNSLNSHGNGKMDAEERSLSSYSKMHFSS